MNEHSSEDGPETPDSQSSSPDEAFDARIRAAWANPVPAASSVAVPEGYEIIDKLGEGGQGVVYKALDTSLGRMVAIKMLAPSNGLLTTEVRQRFAQEMKLAARLNGKGVVEIHRFDASFDPPWAALEFLPDSLEKRWNGKAQPPGKVAALVQKLALTLERVHESLIHRDLKPANVLFAEDSDESKIADLGLARALEAAEDRPDLTRSNAIIGTPAYMAPEQAAGQRELSPAVDIHALGVILYEGLMGRPPFVGRDTTATLKMVQENDPVPPSRLTADVPRDLETICLKCLHKEPARRYSTARALANDLGRFLAGEPIEGKRETWLQWTLRKRRKHPWIAGMLASLVLLFLVVVSLTVWGFRNEIQARKDAEDRADAEHRLLVEATQRRQEQVQARRVAIVRSGDDLARPGAWEAARERYRQALALPGDPVRRLELRLKCIRIDIFLDELDQVETELAELEKEPLGKLLGVWRLEKAVLLLERSMQRVIRQPTAYAGQVTPEESAAFNLLGQVAADDLVPFADRMTARGLLAGSADAMVRYLDLAQERDPGHPYAVMYSALTELIAGRLERAQMGIDRWRRLSPRDPNPELYRIFVLYLQRNDSEAQAAFKAFDEGGRLHQSISPDALAAHKALFALVRVINLQLDEGGIPNPQAGLAVMGQILPSLPAAGGLGQTGVFRAPLPPAQRLELARLLSLGRTVAVQEMPALVLLIPGRNPPLEEAIEEMQGLGRFVPQGLCAYFQGALQAHLGLRAQAKKDTRKAKAMREAVRANLKVALSRPTLFDVRRVCLVGLASHQLREDAPGPLDERQAAARWYIRQAVQVGPPSPPLANHLARLAKLAGDEMMARDLERLSRRR
jgi:hypothetical protein